MPEAGELPEPFVVALFGPTAVGKTGVAIELADRIESAGGRAVAVNCDSMQVYEGLEVISGAPTESDRLRLEHRLVGHVPITSNYSGGAYAREAHLEIDSLLGDGVWPLVVGGTGLYLRAALSDLTLLPGIPPSLRSGLERDWERDGARTTHSRLPDGVRQTVHVNDKKRILRYLGLIQLGIDPHPDTAGGGRLWSERLRHPTLLVGLSEEREELKRRVSKRVGEMASAGAAVEARRAAELGISETASKAIGFRQFLDGDLEAVESAQLGFARRQMTWMRRLEDVTTIKRGGRPDSELAAEVLDLILGRTGVNASRSAPG